MSHYRVKTEYEVEGSYGSVEKRTLYAWHNNSCDIVTFYDEDGDYMFSVEDTHHNNLYDAIERLYAPHTNRGTELIEGVAYMTQEDREKCKI